MNIGLNIKRTKFGPESKGIIAQVQNWIDNDKSGYVKRRLFNGCDGCPFEALVEDSLGSRIKRQSAYAYMCEGEVVGVVFITEISLAKHGHSTMNITYICSNPNDPTQLIESEMISDLKAMQSRSQCLDIFSDISYVNEDLAKVFAANGFYVIKEENNIHVYYSVEKDYEKTL